MSTHLRSSLAPVSLLSAAVLMLLIALPAAASARGAGVAYSLAASAEREQERAGRREAREARAAERRAARAEARSTREQERAARRSARLGSAGEQEAAATAPEGETPANPAAPKTGAPSMSDASNRCRATIETSSGRIVAGETVTVFGVLSCPVGTSAAARQVTISENERGAGAASASILATASTTEADGSYKLATLPLDVNTVFHVRVGNHSARAVVRVAPLVTLSAPSPAAQLSTVGGGRLFGGASSRATFTGTVSPNSAGAQISLQIAYPAVGEQWRTVRFGRVGTDGTFSIAHNFRTAGQASVRVLVHPIGQHVLAASEPLSYEVAQPQNPNLTIHTSAAPASYGQAVTISGVLAGGADQPVTLLTRTAGGGVAVAATETTDANGNYSFTQTPLASSYYRVTHARVKSTTVFEAVRYALTSAVAPSTATAGQPITFSGSVTPAHAGQLVYLERQNPDGIGFREVGVGTLNEDSTYAISHQFSTVGNYVMRVRVPSDPGKQGSAGAPFALAVTAAPAAALLPEEEPAPSLPSAR